MIKDEGRYSENDKATRFFTDLLIEKGFEMTDIPVLQDADFILDAAGEKARKELFFIDSEAESQSALRYDLTLPVCKKFLNDGRYVDPGSRFVTPARLCVAGSVFRRRPRGDHRPEEFHQVGFEYIGFEERTKTDAECLATAVSLLDHAGVSEPEIQIADIALSSAVIDALGIPVIKAGRLKSALRHRDKFMRILNAGGKGAPHDASLAAIGALSPDKARELVADILKLTGLTHSGLRTKEEITERFLKKAEEANEPDLDADHVSALTAFYDLTAEAVSAAEKIRALLRPFTVSVDDFLQYYERRLDYLRAAGVDLSRITYGALLKRKPEYYSGFMFSLDAPNRPSPSALGGGGRYDTMFQKLGAPFKIPAVGCELRPADIFAVAPPASEI